MTYHGHIERVRDIGRTICRRHQACFEECRILAVHVRQTDRIIRVVLESCDCVSTRVDKFICATQKKSRFWFGAQWYWE
jgi:hypothetical protein